MRFKGFVWPHNPRTYTIEYQRSMALHKIPLGRFCLQNMGLTRRVMKGEGEFVGPSAYSDFKELANLFYEETPGTLIHPVWQSSKAYFVELCMMQEPRQDYVKYRFVFWECSEGESSQTLTKIGVLTDSGTAAAQKPREARACYHTVVAGETLWGIAGKYGGSLTRLLALNPQIKNPNLIHTGERVRVS